MQQPDESTLAERVRAAHRNYATGVTVVTTIVDEVPYGLTISSFSSVSLDPPSVLFCVNERSKTYLHLVQARHVGINLLGQHQSDVAELFATKEPDKFTRVDWTTGHGGVPLLTGAIARMQAHIDQRHKVGSHMVFICSVVEADVSDGEPLVYWRSSYMDSRGLTPLG